MEDYKSYGRRKPSPLTEDIVRGIFEGTTLVLALSLIAVLFVLFASVSTGVPLQFLTEVTP